MVDQKFERSVDKYDSTRRHDCLQLLFNPLLVIILQKSQRVEPLLNTYFKFKKWQNLHFFTFLIYLNF